MSRYLVAIFMILSGCSSLQVQAPDYKDKAIWKYIECGEELIQPKDESLYTFHEDYRLVSPLNEQPDLVVIYRPVKKEIFEKEGEEVFRTVSRKEPWLMLYVDVNNYTTRPIQLFEYGGRWKNKFTFSSGSETMEYLREHYNFR